MQKGKKGKPDITEPAPVVDPCLRKAPACEPLFTLRAQDATASIFVDLWADAQRWVRLRVSSGVSPALAVMELGQKLRGVLPSCEMSDTVTDKDEGAYQIANDMRKWPIHKLAD